MTGTKFPHYCFGHLSWVCRMDVAPNTAEFKLITAFKRDLFSGSGTDGYPVTGDKVLDTLGGTSLAFGDGTFTGMLRFTVIEFDVKHNWILCQAIDPLTPKNTILHTYLWAVDPYTNQPWQAGVQSCYRIGSPEHVNNPEGSFRLQTAVEFITGNSSPVVFVPVIVNVPCNSVFSFPVGAADPNGDKLTCRLATGTEASGFVDGFTQPGPPYISNPLNVDPETFVVTWNTTGTEPGQLWSYHIVVEDGKTQVGMDALIRIIEQNGEPPRCSDLEGTFKAEVAVPFSIEINAIDPDGKIIDVNSLNLPHWAALEVISTIPSTQVKAKITGTPKSEDGGLYIIPVIFTDDDDNQSVTYLTISVDCAYIMQTHPLQGG